MILLLLYKLDDNLRIAIYKQNNKVLNISIKKMK